MGEQADQIMSKGRPVEKRIFALDSAAHLTHVISGRYLTVVRITCPSDPPCGYAMEMVPVHAMPTSAERSGSLHRYPLYHWKPWWKKYAALNEARFWRMPCDREKISSSAEARPPAKQPF